MDDRGTVSITIGIPRNSTHNRVKLILNWHGSQAGTYKKQRTGVFFVRKPTLQGVLVSGDVYEFSRMYEYIYIR